MYFKDNKNVIYILFYFMLNFFVYIIYEVFIEYRFFFNILDYLDFYLLYFIFNSKIEVLYFK